MNRSRIITFLSDFGCDGVYAASCEAVIARIDPEARMLHISHEVAVGDIAAGASILERVCPLCPTAVHLAVIDPGVGTARRPVALETARGDAMVGPDNGLLPPAADALGGTTRAWLLDSERLRAQAGLASGVVSSTFHGRDIFAPAAALLSTSAPPETYATPLDPVALVRLPSAKWSLTDDGALAEVLEVDRFGNVGLALRFEDLPLTGTAVTVEVEGESLPVWSARVVQTYGELRPGELGLYGDSWGMVALALNGASAAELLTVYRGMLMRLTRVPSDALAPAPAPSESTGRSFREPTA